MAGQDGVSGERHSLTPDPTVEGDYPNRTYAWFVVAILIGTAILAYTDRQVLSLLVGPIRSDLGISDGQMSLLLGTAFAVTYGIAGIPLGVLADRVSRRWLLFTGVLVWSIGTVACASSHTLGTLFAARIVVGLGEAVLSPAAISMISDYFPPSRRGMAVGCFLSGIALGVGSSILIGGSVLHAVEAGAFAGSALADLPAWRMVLMLIGAPGFVWALVILLVREPVRRVRSDTAGSADSATARAMASWVRVAPVYLVVAAASFVDNAVGAWAPELLIRGFSRHAADIGVQLGLLETPAFGGGVLLGGWLADRAGLKGGWSYKLRVCLVAGLLILPVAAMMNASRFELALWAIPAYFALSGIVTACGFSAILDLVPNRSRGFAMGVSFFLNVAVGGGLGAPAVTATRDYVLGGDAGLGPALGLTVGVGYVAALVAIAVSFWNARRDRRAAGAA